MQNGKKSKPLRRKSLAATTKAAQKSHLDQLKLLLGGDGTVKAENATFASVDRGVPNKHARSRGLAERRFLTDVSASGTRPDPHVQLLKARPAVPNTAVRIAHPNSAAADKIDIQATYRDYSTPRPSPHGKSPEMRELSSYSSRLRNSGLGEDVGPNERGRQTLASPPRQQSGRRWSTDPRLGWLAADSPRELFRNPSRPRQGQVPVLKRVDPKTWLSDLMKEKSTVLMTPKAFYSQQSLNSPGAQTPPRAQTPPPQSPLSRPRPAELFSDSTFLPSFFQQGESSRTDDGLRLNLPVPTASPKIAQLCPEKRERDSHSRESPCSKTQLPESQLPSVSGKGQAEAMVEGAVLREAKQQASREDRGIQPDPVVEDWRYSKERLFSDSEASSSARSSRAKRDATQRHLRPSSALTGQSGKILRQRQRTKQSLIKAYRAQKAALQQCAESRPEQQHEPKSGEENCFCLPSHDANQSVTNPAPQGKTEPKVPPLRLKSRHLQELEVQQSPHPASLSDDEPSTAGGSLRHGSGAVRKGRGDTVEAAAVEAKVKAEQPQSMEAMLAVIANLQERIAVLETRGSRGRQYLDDWEVSKKLQEVPDGPPAHPSSSDSMGELSQTADEQRRIPLEGYPAGNREALELDTARGNPVASLAQLSSGRSCSTANGAPSSVSAHSHASEAEADVITPPVSAHSQENQSEAGSTSGMQAEHGLSDPSPEPGLRESELLLPEERSSSESLPTKPLSASSRGSLERSHSSPPQLQASHESRSVLWGKQGVSAESVSAARPKFEVVVGFGPESGPSITAIPQEEGDLLGIKPEDQQPEEVPAIEDEEGSTRGLSVGKQSPRERDSLWDSSDDGEDFFVRAPQSVVASLKAEENETASIHGKCVNEKALSIRSRPGSAHAARRINVCSDQEDSADTGTVTLETGDVAIPEVDVHPEEEEDRNVTTTTAAEEKFLQKRVSSDDAGWFQVDRQDLEDMQVGQTLEDMQVEEEALEQHQDAEEPKPEGEDEEEETVVQGDMHHACYVNAVLDLFFEKVDWRRIATTPIGLEHYVALERSGPEMSDMQHIYNKVLFDATNEALKELLPPYRCRLSDAQRRTRREALGSESWRSVLRSETVKLVMKWMTPCESIESLLLQDIKQDDLQRNETPHNERILTEGFGSGPWLV